MTKAAQIEINRDVAAKVLATVDAGLSHGLGKAKPGFMCVEAAVCYALGLPHGDDPGCVSPAIRSLKITLNDRYWSSNEARAKGLRRLALAQLRFDLGDTLPTVFAYGWVQETGTRRVVGISVDPVTDTAEPTVN